MKGIKFFQKSFVKPDGSSPVVSVRSETPSERKEPDMYEKLPQELKERGAFCLWRYEQRNGDTTKVPYQPNGLRGDSTNRAAFTDFVSVFSHMDVVCRSFGV